MGHDQFKPIYTTITSVQVRLANKVQFQSGDTPIDGELPNELLLQLIVDAETAVEQDLRGRYFIPFQSKSQGSWAGLPDHSRRAVRRAVDLRCVVEVLRTDFGRGTHVNAEDYFKQSSEEYSAYIDKLLGRDAEAANAKHDRFRFTPPLEDLLLAKTNMADDGYRGMIINTDASRNDAASYAEDQVNNPAQSYVNQRPGPRIF